MVTYFSSQAPFILKHRNKDENYFFDEVYNHLYHLVVHFQAPFETMGKGKGNGPRSTCFHHENKDHRVPFWTMK